MDNWTNFWRRWRTVFFNLVMKKIIYIIAICLMPQFAYSAGSDSSGSEDNKSNYFNDAKN